ncbi:MAG TPA: glycosyltransferase family 2 protein [Blastocatellia bacterium]|nr:glycosyltransferase family 2 protein [Blastocatellia bacterium]
MELPREQIDVTIVVCTCDRAAMLPPAIESLLRQQTQGRFSYEILVVDDGSVDDTARVVAELAAGNAGAPLRYLYKRAGGVAEARNFGAHHARGERIAYFDDDQLAEPNWLLELMTVALRERAACVGGSRDLLLPKSPILALGPKARAVLGEHELGEITTYDSSKELPNTGNVLITKQLFERLKGFNGLLRDSGEDTDFFQRVRHSGTALWYASRARVHHVIPRSRVTPQFLRWYSVRIGVAAARLQCKSGRLPATLLTALQRLMVSGLRDLPLHLLSWLTRNQALEMDCLCTTGYTVGYLRGCLHFLWPHLFNQQQFMKYVDFRSHGGERSAADARPSANGQGAAF